MANRKEYPIRFTCKGLADALDATDTFQGAALQMQNLIFNQSNPELVVSRPGVGAPITSFVGFTAPTGVAVMITIGPIIYGMVSTARFPGHDEPFAFNTTTDTFITISDVTAANTPLTQAITGDWTPPTMAVIGDQIIVTHPGFGGTATVGAFTGSITGSTLTITGASGTINIGSNITGVGVPVGTVITQFVSGTYGGNGVYLINNLLITPIGPVAMTAAGGEYFGVINLATVGAPFWYATNTGPFGLPAVPTSVSNFGNRAYFSVVNMEFFSDVLAPTTATNAGQSLTLGDTTPITGQCGLPIQTTSAGVIGALLVFKQFQVWQITGDEATPTTNPLYQNFLSLTFGTQSPRTIIQTPAGVFFIASDGPYYISPYGQVLPLTNDPSKLVQDLRTPFVNILNPTRAAASYTGSIYRVCLDTIITGVEVTNDYWFDLTVRRWSGPHTFNYDSIFQIGNQFVLSNRRLGAFLFLSQYLPNLASVYNDNGAPLISIGQTAMLPKTPNINEKQVVESTIELASQAATQIYVITAEDEKFDLIGTASVTVVTGLPLWGSGILWGAFDWASGSILPATYAIPWIEPLIFKKLTLTITAQSSFGLAIGTTFSKYRDNGYTVLYNTILPVLPLPFPRPIVWDGGELWDGGDVWL